MKGLSATGVRIALLLAMAAWSLLASAPARADTLQAALVKYATGDFAKAEQMFKRVLVSRSARAGHPTAWKFLGICQILQGRESEGVASFVNALALDSSTTVERSETFDDDTVLNAFASAKQKHAQSAAAKRQSSSRASAKSRSSAPKRRRASEAREVRETRESRSDNSSFDYAALMPFGIGQHAAGRTELGAAFTIGQLVLLGTGAYLYHVKAAGIAVTAEDDMKQRDFIARQEYSAGNFARGREIDAEASAARESQKARIEQAERQAMICYAGFASLWAASALEATIANKNMRTRARLGSNGTATPMPTGTEADATSAPSMRLGLAYLPAGIGRGETLLVSWGLDL